MKIIADVIASVSGPDFNHPKARLLFDEESGDVAVFVLPGKEPAFFFKYTTPAAGVRVSAMQGSGTLEDGGQVSWRRVGSSCSFKLAKCQVSTQALTSRWLKSRASA